MSWVERELKKRAALPPETVSGASTRSDTGLHDTLVRTAALWARFEDANQVLPPELRLRREVHSGPRYVGEGPAFPVQMLAENGACLGFAEEGIRYLWPERNPRQSNNFWIRWKDERGYVTVRRVGRAVVNPVTASQPFDETAIGYVIQCLVTGTRIKAGALRPGRFLFFWPRR
jgi:hypothetical protein